MESSRGRVLVVSCSSYLSTEDIVREVFKGEIPEPVSISDLFNGYLWQIENKYYTADIQVCSCCVTSPPKTESKLALNFFFQSIVIAFDENESSFKEVNSWLSYVKLQDPSILLLLNSGKGSDLVISRAEVVRWCLSNSFELINMSIQEEEDSQEDEFDEKFGIARVIEALQCAKWPNMKMKENPYLTNPEEDLAGWGCTNAPSNEGSSEGNNNCDDIELPSSLSNDGDEIESFEELFQRLAQMKERASHLPSKERKSYAEKVAIAFWSSLGGDDEEIAGLEDDSDG